MDKIPPSIFNAFLICKRQAWLMFHGINGDQNNTFVEIGRLLDDVYYKNEKKKIFIADLHCEIDMLQKDGGDYFVVEIKKSSKMLDSAIFELKYYLYLLKKFKDIEMKGIIKIPEERLNKSVELMNNDIIKIESILEEMQKIFLIDLPPISELKAFCSKCCHCDFCFA